MPGNEPASRWRKALRGALCRALPRSPLGDTLFTAVFHLQLFGRLPRWRRPETFNEHLLQLKLSGALYDPLRQVVADKHLLEDYVTQVAGADYALETLDLLGSDREIEAYRPSRWPCVLKPSHLSGRFMLLREAGEAPDRALLKSWMGQSYYDESREANYRYLRPRILVQPYYVDRPDGVPCEFNVTCIGGRPKFLHLIRDRYGDATRVVYSASWTRLPFGIKKPSEGTVPRPAFLDEMLSVAAQIAEPFGFIRVDFLVADGRPKVCELTNLPNNALNKFWPQDYDRLLGPLFTRPEAEIEEILGLPAAAEHAAGAGGAPVGMDTSGGRCLGHAR